MVAGCCAIFALGLSLQAKAQRLARMVVAQDGSGNYTTIQAAFQAIPPGNTAPVTVFVKEGLYREKLRLDSSKSNVTLVGEDRFKTILVYGDHSGEVRDGIHINTGNSQSFLEAGNGFTAENLTIRNDAGPAAGQSVALRVTGDECRFLRCRLTGDQDVLFTSNPSSHLYFRDCYIEGTTDFIFGAATAYFDRCHIHSKKNSHVTAASTPQDHPFGYVFYDCVLTADTSVTAADLGRPWRPYACVAFIHCYLGSHIVPAGWSNWHGTDNDKTARFSEYENEGAGAATAGRVAWSHQIPEESIPAYAPEKVLGAWIAPTRSGGRGSSSPTAHPLSSSANLQP